MIRIDCNGKLWRYTVGIEHEHEHVFKSLNIPNTSKFYSPISSRIRRRIATVSVLYCTALNVQRWFLPLNWHSCDFLGKSSIEWMYELNYDSAVKLITEMRERNVTGLWHHFWTLNAVIFSLTLPSAHRTVARIITVVTKNTSSENSHRY